MYVWRGTLFCNAVIYVLSCFAIISLSKKLNLCSCFCVAVSILYLFLMMPWVGLQCVIVAFPGHTHFMSFHQGIHCSLRQNPSSEKYNFYSEIISCVPSIYPNTPPDFIVCSFMENSIGLKRVKYEKSVSY